MSDNNFDANKTVQQILNAILRPSSVEEAMEGLTAASAQDPDARFYIASKLEKRIFIDVYAKMSAEDIKEAKEMLATLVAARNAGGELDGLQDVLESISGVTKIIKFVSDNKGDAVHPLLKSCIAGLAKLSDAESSLPENQWKVLCDVIEKSQAAQATKKNRPNGPGL